VQARGKFSQSCMQLVYSRSTFVDILAGKRKRGHVSGSVDFVPEHNHSSEGELLVAFVDQDDVLPSMSSAFISSRPSLDSCLAQLSTKQ
jgi:hypothetical protein